MAQLFLSYSHVDEAFRDQLEKHLAMLKRQGFIEVWHDRRIIAGEAIDQVISLNLERADIVLLLVSPDFLASDYCYDREMTRAIERHKAGEATVIPIILRACDWRDAPFGGLLAAPKDGKPITQWPDRDAAFLDVTTAIKGALRRRDPAVGASATTAAAPAPMAAATRPRSDVRSSNLRTTKHFTERDRDAFLHETFDYLAKFFETSLDELSARNAGIEGQFRRIDANTFTAVAYRHGAAVARSRIFMGGFPGGNSIAYSHDTGPTNSLNESISVENDDQMLYLRALGMAVARTNPGGKLSIEGAAEYFWEMFMEPLQRA
jgi:TIR domain